MRSDTGCNADFLFRTKHLFHWILFCDVLALATYEGKKNNKYVFDTLTIRMTRVKLKLTFPFLDLTCTPSVRY